MAIDVTKSPQYTALQKSYDDKIALEQKVKDTQADWEKYYNDPNQALPDSEKHYQEDSDLLWKLDPDCSIRNSLAADPLLVDKLRKEETLAMEQCSLMLQADDAIKAAETAGSAAIGSGAHSINQDVMTRVMTVFAMLGKANDLLTGDHMDNISGNVDKITQLNSLQETLRSARPEGTVTTATKDISASTMRKLQELGVEVPLDKMHLNASPNGPEFDTYTVSQATYDTTINNVQSQQSSLTTLNQNKTIDLNKSIDVGQQCTTFQSTYLTKWAELMQKLTNG